MIVVKYCGQGRFQFFLKCLARIETLFFGVSGAKSKSIALMVFGYQEKPMSQMIIGLISLLILKLLDGIWFSTYSQQKINKVQGFFVQKRYICETFEVVTLNESRSTHKLEATCVLWTFLWLYRIPSLCTSHVVTTSCHYHISVCVPVSKCVP